LLSKCLAVMVEMSAELVILKFVGKSLTTKMKYKGMEIFFVS
jgi:hypothetical protein